jgi:hypothetical protein
VSLADAIRSRDLDPSRIATARRDDIDTFIELHIEQGPILEQKRIPVGVAEAIAAIEQVECTVQGRADGRGDSLLG